MTKNVALSISVCLAILFAATASSETPDLTGTWVLDEELTKELQPPIKKHRRGQGVRGFVGSGGILTPLPGGGGSPRADAAGLKTPLVLECGELTLDKSEDKVTISCVNGLKRDFNAGKLHGRNTKLRKSRLTESYRSTSRSVQHLIKLDKKGNLIATVTIQPKGGVAQKYVRAFNRKQEVSEDTSQVEESASSSS